MKSIYETPYIFCPTCKSPLKRKEFDKQSLLSCLKCDFVFWNNPKPVVSIVLYNKGKLLLLQRATEPFKDYWCLPGGFINFQETTEEAIIREVKEETGVTAAVTGLVGVYRIDNDPRGVTIDIVFAGTMERTIALSHEHCSFRFFDPHTLPQKIAYKHREAIVESISSE